MRFVPPPQYSDSALRTPPRPARQTGRFVVYVTIAALLMYAAIGPTTG